MSNNRQYVHYDILNNKKVLIILLLRNCNDLRFLLEENITIKCNYSYYIRNIILGESFFPYIIYSFQHIRL